MTPGQIITTTLLIVVMFPLVLFGLVEMFKGSSKKSRKEYINKWRYDDDKR